MSFEYPLKEGGSFVPSHEGNRRQAAEVLGIGGRTLYRKLKAYGLG